MIFKTITRKSNFILLLILFVGSYFRLTNLEIPRMWQDEAEYALLSKSTLNHGFPLSSENGIPFFNIEINEQNKNIEDPIYEYKSMKSPQGTFHAYYTWLPFYIIAGAMKFFGTNDFGARIASSVFGIGSLALLMLLFQAHFNQASAIGIGILFSLDTGQIQISRMAQHNSFAVFFTILTLLFYLNLLKNKNIKNEVLVALSFGALFHCHQVAFLILLLHILTHILLIEKNYRWFFLLLTAALVIILPWFYLVSFWETLTFTRFNYEQKFTAIFHALLRFYDSKGLYLFLLFVSILAVWKKIIFRKKNGIRSEVYLIGALPLSYFVLSDLLTPWNFRVEYRTCFLALAITCSAALVWVLFEKIKIKGWLSQSLFVISILDFGSFTNFSSVHISQRYYDLLQGTSVSGFSASWVPSVMDYISKNGYTAADIIVADDSLVYAFEYGVKAYNPWAISSEKLNRYHTSRVWIIEHPLHKMNCLETWQYREDKCVYENYPYIPRTKSCLPLSMNYKAESLRIWKCD